jgi:hypothetical protein
LLDNRLGANHPGGFFMARIAPLGSIGYNPHSSLTFSVIKIFSSRRLIVLKKQDAYEYTTLIVQITDEIAEKEAFSAFSDKFWEVRRKIWGMYDVSVMIQVKLMTDDNWDPLDFVGANALVFVPILRYNPFAHTVACMLTFGLYPPDREFYMDPYLMPKQYEIKFIRNLNQGGGQ